MRVIGIVLVLLMATGLGLAEQVTATGEATLEDARGDVRSMSSSDGEHPGRDVVKLHFASDGQKLDIHATLSEKVSGTFAGDVVELFVDTDGNAATGGEATWSESSGFEFHIELLVCIEYESGAEACVGSAGNKANAYFAVAKAEETAGGTEIKSPFELHRTPISGSVVTSDVVYSELGLKPGQTIRIYARESSGPFDESSYFPELELTLN